MKINIKKIVDSPLQIIIPILMCTILSSMLSFSFSVFVINILLSMITLPLIIMKDYKYAKLYTIIFIVSVFYVFLVYYANLFAYGSPYYIGGSDDLNFEQKGFIVADYNIYNPAELRESVLDIYDNSPFFVTYMAILINFANLFDGYSTFIPRIVNVYLLIWILMIFEYLLKKYSNISNKGLYTWIGIFALTPNIQYINAHVFRDTFNLLQIFLIVFLVDKLTSTKAYMKKPLILAILLCVIYSTYYTRSNSLIFALAISIFCLSAKHKFNKYIIIAAIPLLFISNFIENIELQQFSSSYSEYLINLSGGLSSYVFTQPLLPFGIILRTLYAFIVPFPNFFELFKNTDMILLDFVNFLIYCGVIIQIIFIPFLLKRLLKFDWLVFSFGICFLGIIATTFTFRHVMLYYPFMVALIIDGYLSSKESTKKYILIASIIIALLLGLIYLALKAS